MLSEEGLNSNWKLEGIGLGLIKNGWLFKNNSENQHVITRQVRRIPNLRSCKASSAYGQNCTTYGSLKYYSQQKHGLTETSESSNASTQKKNPIHIYACSIFCVMLQTSVVILTKVKVTLQSEWHGAKFAPVYRAIFNPVRPANTHKGVFGTPKIYSQSMFTLVSNALCIKLKLGSSIHLPVFMLSALFIWTSIDDCLGTRSTTLPVLLSSFEKMHFTGRSTPLPVPLIFVLFFLSFILSFSFHLNFFLSFFLSHCKPASHAWKCIKFGNVLPTKVWGK